MQRTGVFAARHTRALHLLVGSIKAHCDVMPIPIRHAPQVRRPAQLAPSPVAAHSAQRVEGEGIVRERRGGGEVAPAYDASVGVGVGVGFDPHLEGKWLTLLGVESGAGVYVYT